MDGRDKPGHDDRADKPFIVAPLERRRARWLFLALLFGFLFASAAHADLRVCNKTGAMVNLAVGVNVGGNFATEGWWTVTPGSCATPVRGPLKSRYVYLYAIDINAVDVTKGKAPMCVDSGKFRFSSITDCWRRGLQAANFVEIDTLDASDWTTFLAEPGK